MVSVATFVVSLLPEVVSAAPEVLAEVGEVVVFGLRMAGRGLPRRMMVRGRGRKTLVYCAMMGDWWNVSALVGRSEDVG